MAYTDFFDEINNCMGVSSMGVIRRQAVTGVTPNILYAIGGVQVSITIFDVLIRCTFTDGGGTLTLETDIAGAGNLALSSAMACAADTTIARTATIVAAQSVVGPADTIECAKNANTNVALVHILFYLT